MRATALFILIITLGFIIGSAMVTIYNPQISSVATADSATIDSATFDSVATIDEPTAKVVITTIPNTKVETTAENTTEPITVAESTQSKTEEIETTIHIEETTKEIEQEPEPEQEPEQIENDTDYEFLLDADNIDYGYIPKAISLSGDEREEITRIVMGEFGGGGFTGCALIAQCIRDAIDSYGYSAMSIKSSMQYYGYNSYPSAECYEAVDWIFDGNAAVQHRILVMNNSSGGWHATQNFVVYYQGVWFYDMWW